MNEITQNYFLLGHFFVYLCFYLTVGKQKSFLHILIFTIKSKGQGTTTDLYEKSTAT